MDIESVCTGLSQNEDGVWCSDTHHPVSYPTDGNDRSFQIEDGSFWFAHRNECIVSAIRSFPPSQNGTIFDIGGGNGFVSKGLMAARFEVALVEPGYQGALNAVKRGVKTVICAVADLTHFRKSALPAIGLFDVVEHIKDDTVFIIAMRELLQDDGLIYITVPAHQMLWSDEDIAAGHFRRYSLPQISALLENNGFRVLYRTYIFQALLLPILLLRVLPFRLGRRKQLSTEAATQDHASNGGIVNRILTRLLSKEISVIADAKPLSPGATCLIVAQKVG